VVVVRERNVLGRLEVWFGARYSLVSNTMRASTLRLGELRRIEYW
jgi:hypothetical protein